VPTPADEVVLMDLTPVALFQRLRAGNSSLLRQGYVDHIGNTEFTTAQILTAVWTKPRNASR
jgi:K+-sensing histidine kinase KdpD